MQNELLTDYEDLKKQLEQTRAQLIDKTAALSIKDSNFQELQAICDEQAQELEMLKLKLPNDGLKEKFDAQSSELAELESLYEVQ